MAFDPPAGDRTVPLKLSAASLPLIWDYLRGCAKTLQDAAESPTPGYRPRDLRDRADLFALDAREISRAMREHVESVAGAESD